MAPITSPLPTVIWSGGWPGSSETPLYVIWPVAGLSATTGVGCDGVVVVLRATERCVCTAEALPGVPQATAPVTASLWYRYAVSGGSVPVQVLSEAGFGTSVFHTTQPARMSAPEPVFSSGESYGVTVR